MSPLPTISVALATYNGERYLRAQLDSLASQELLPAELVVGDDRSSDHTVDILNDFARTAPFPVRLQINDRRLGYADNFLDIARRCRGDVVAFCDQDDMWYPQKLSRVAAAFARRPEAVLVAHYARVVDAHGKDLGRRWPRYSLEGVYRPPSLPLTYFPGFTMIARRSLFDVTDLDIRSIEGHSEEPTFSHDVLVWLMAACVGNVVVLPEELASYRQHQGNMFGAPHVGISEKLRRTLAANADTCDGQAASLRQQTDYLTSWAAERARGGHVDWARNARARASQYRELESSARQRAHLYRAPTTRQALARWRDTYWADEVTPPARRRSVWKNLVVALANPVTRRGRGPDERAERLDR